MNFLYILSVAIFTLTFTAVAADSKTNHTTATSIVKVEPNKATIKDSAKKTPLKTAAITTNNIKKITIPTKKLVKRLKTNDTKVIIATVATISAQNSGAKYVQEAFSKLLSGTNQIIRQAVLDEIYFFDSVKHMLPSLTLCLSDSDEDIRDDAMDIIGEIESRKMMNLLVQCTTNQYTDVRDNADFYLSYHSGETFTNICQWGEWWSSNKTTFVFE